MAGTPVAHSGLCSPLSFPRKSMVSSRVGPRLRRSRHPSPVLPPRSAPPAALRARAPRRTAHAPESRVGLREERDVHIGQQLPILLGAPPREALPSAWQLLQVVRNVSLGMTSS